jgi:hypothetical protein
MKNLRWSGFHLGNLLTTVLYKTIAVDVLSLADKINTNFTIKGCFLT